jgi:hypothetical protein
VVRLLTAALPWAAFVLVWASLGSFICGHVPDKAAAMQLFGGAMCVYGWRLGLGR